MGYRRASGSAAVLWLLACGVTEPPVDQLSVTVALSVSEISPGDTTDITIHATNPTKHVLEFSTNACVLVLIVSDAAGNEVYPGDVPCFDILVTHSVGPGESLEETVEFDGWGRTDWSSSSERYPLPSGTYWVRGAVGSHRENPSQPVALEVR